MVIMIAVTTLDTIAVVVFTCMPVTLTSILTEWDTRDSFSTIVWHVILFFLQKEVGIVELRVLFLLVRLLDAKQIISTEVTVKPTFLTVPRWQLLFRKINAVFAIRKHAKLFVVGMIWIQTESVMISMMVSAMIGIREITVGPMIMNIHGFESKLIIRLTPRLRNFVLRRLIAHESHDVISLCSSCGWYVHRCS